jgi:hypothetical protein
MGNPPPINSFDDGYRAALHDVLAQLGRLQSDNNYERSGIYRSISETQALLARHDAKGNL